MADSPACVALADQALLLAERGALEWAHTLASQAVRQLGAVGQPDSDARDAVAQALCLAALRMLQHGLDAGGLLRALGVRRVLAPAVWAHRPTPLQAQAPASSAPVALLTDVLPDTLLKALQQGFKPDSPYWDAHHYRDPATPFFSHFLPSLDGSGGSALQQAARLIHRQLSRLWPNAAGRAVAAEVWAHCRQPQQPHQLHWDTDESQLRSRRSSGSSKRLPHPEISTVLFLGCCRCAGPTVVLSERLSSRSSGSDASDEGTAWLAHPVQGALLAFRGGLLHGVLPGGCLPCASHRPRLTLMCALWGPSMAARTPAAALGPAMPLPDPASANPAAAWLRELPACAVSPQQQSQRAKAWEVHSVRPAWAGVRSSEGEAEGPLRTAALPDLRFFLREAGELQRRYLPSQ